MHGTLPFIFSLSDDVLHIHKLTPRYLTRLWTLLQVMIAYFFHGDKLWVEFRKVSLYGRRLTSGRRWIVRQLNDLACLISNYTGSIYFDCVLIIFWWYLPVLLVMRCLVRIFAWSSPVLTFFLCFCQAVQETTVMELWISYARLFPNLFK
jgi:hypothetical protein